MISVTFTGLSLAHLVRAKNAPFACPSISEKPSRDEARKCWSDQMDKVGAGVAAKDFDVWNRKFDLIQQHVYAHEFGRTLYEHTGVPGLGFCSLEFQYGCYHEFTGMAIRDKGIEIVPTLNDSCRKNLGSHALGCQHGIGHGIQAALGYKDEDFLKTLSICRGLPYSNPISGCYGGAVMEFTLRTISSAEGGAVRPMTQGKEDLCAPLEKEFQPTCYYQIPQWWYRSLREEEQNEQVAFGHVGDFCRNAASAGRERCFRGIGNIAPSEAMTDTKNPIAICRLVSARDHNAFKYCIEDVANSFVFNAYSRKDVPTICGVLNGDEIQACKDRVGFDLKRDS